VKRILAGSLLVLGPPMALAGTLSNGDFNQAVGEWPDGDGPPGWELSLDDADQRGIVEPAAFAHTGENIFYFNHLQTGYGGSRVDQCVELDGPRDLELALMVRPVDPHPDMRVRLRLDFYADGICDEDSANADAEQVETDIPLDPQRTPPDTWVELLGQTRLDSELGTDVGSVRVSFRLRDRSADGQPVDPPRRVYFDNVMLRSPVGLLPTPTRQALRDFYQATEGDGWYRNDGWMAAEGTECQWYGITCTPEGDEILRLDLAGNNLAGTVPESILALDTIESGGLDLCFNPLEIPGGGVGQFVDGLQLGAAGERCETPQLEPFDRLSAGILYKPARSGEGYALHMEGESSGILYWSTFDAEGDPVWLFGAGQADNRVFRVDTLYRAERVDGQVETHPVGRASLALTDCQTAQFRFETTWPGDGAGGTRELEYVDSGRACGRGPAGVDDDELANMGGVWFDPLQAGEGLSLEPLPGNRLFFNWYTFNEAGQPRWITAVAHAAGPGFETEELLTPYGGSLFGEFDYDDLEFVSSGHAWIDTTGQSPELTLADPDGQESGFNIVRLAGGPNLLASSGNRLHLTMDTEDVDWLYDRDPYNNERLPGSYRFFDWQASTPLHGLRFRGNTSRLHPKKSFNIRYEQPQGLLYDSERMNLNAMYTDPSMMRESLSFLLFDELEQPASRTRYFDFWLNGIYEGLHIHIQRVDEHLLESHGLNPDGTLVRDRFRQAMSSDPLVDRRSAFGFDLGIVPPDERADFLAERFDYRGDPEWEHLVELVEWVYDTPAGQSFAQGFQERFNTENFVDWLAIHWLIGDIDSWDDDYWLYLDHDDADARWHIIPWDKDQSFGSDFRDGGWFTSNDFFAYKYPLSGGATNELGMRFVDTPELRDLARSRLEELVDEIFTEEWFNRKITRHAERLTDSTSIAPGPTAFHRHSANHHGELGRMVDHVESIRDFIALRYRYIQRQLDPIGGEPLKAQAVVSEGSDEPVYLTDATGFSLLSLEPVSPFAHNGELSAWIDPADWTGIDREWTVEYSGPPGQVKLVLYYQNDIVSWLADNWWTEGDEPVGCQDFLVMHRVDENGAAEPLDSRANPYSNRVSATIDLVPGSHRFALVLDEEAAGQAGCM